jgi:hypothetical protein
MALHIAPAFRTRTLVGTEQPSEEAVLEKLVHGIGGLPDWKASVLSSHDGG